MVVELKSFIYLESPPPAPEVNFNQDNALYFLLVTTGSETILPYALGLQQKYRSNPEKELSLEIIPPTQEILFTPRALITEILRSETVNVHSDWKSWSLFNRLITGDFDSVGMRTELFNAGLIDKNSDFEDLYKVYEALEDWKNKVSEY